MPKGEKTKLLWENPEYRIKILKGIRKHSEKCLIKKECLICNKEFEIIRARRYKKYCSSICGYKATSEIRKINNPGGFKKGIKVSLGRYWTEEQKKRRGDKWLGKNNPKWKGGISTFNQILRGSSKMKYWRNSVFRRDNYTCQICGKKGGDLNADHIKLFSDFPKLRFDINNGRTLCVRCHKNVKVYA